MKEGGIEIQGDKRELLKQLLEQKGFKVKLAEVLSKTTTSYMAKLKIKNVCKGNLQTFLSF